MSRVLTGALDAALQAPLVRPAVFVNIATSGAPILAWSGIGDQVFDGDTYQGVGNFGGFSDVEETEEIEANGLKFMLSGVPAALISIALQSMQQGKPAKLFFGALNVTTNVLIVDPFMIYEGLTDVPEIDDTGDTASISFSTENRLIKLEIAPVRRYTDRDQRLRDPTDKGFEFVPSLQDKQIKFGGG